MCYSLLSKTLTENEGFTQVTSPVAQDFKNIMVPVLKHVHYLSNHTAQD